MERPLAALGFSFFLSLILASFLDVKMTVVLAALCLVALLTGMSVGSLRRNRRIMTVLFAAVAAFSLYAAEELLVCRPLQKWDGATARLRLQTLDFVQQTAEYSGRYVTVRVLDGDLPKDTKLTFWIQGNELYPSPYDILEGDFRLAIPSDSTDGQMRGYSKSQKIFLNAYSADYGETDIALTEPDSRPWMVRIVELRRDIRMLVLSQPGMDDVSGLMNGIAFGFKEQIPEEIQYDFRTVGVSHLLAVSGLQTALIAQALLALLLFCRVPKKVSSPVAAAGVLLFMALTGFTASVMRAGIMSILFALGLLFGREPDSLNSLGLAVLIITLLNPYAVNDAGLLLSFAATFGLLVLERPLQRVTADKLEAHAGWTRLLARPVRAVDVTIAATIPTLPVILFTFGQISIVSPLSNLLMVFPSTVVTFAVCLGVLFAPLWPLRFLSAALFWAGKWVARYLVWVADLLASLPFSSVRTQQPFVLLWVPGAMLLVYIGWRFFGRKGVRITALCAVVALLGGLLVNTAAMRRVATVTVLQAGDSTALLLERDGRAGLVLTGDEEAVTSAQRSLKRWNIQKLDFLMLPDGDAECAFCPMILTDSVQVDGLVTERDGKYRDTLDALKIGGDRLYFDDGEIAFWNDCRASLIDGGWLRITLGKTRLLLCPSDGNAASLSEEQRQTNLVIYTSTPPANATSITAQAGVLNCRLKMLPSVVKALPQGLYPVENTSRTEVTLLTRGQGDILFKGGNSIAAV